MPSSTARFLAQVRLGSAATNVPKPRDGDWQAPPAKTGDVASAARAKSAGSTADPKRADPAPEPRMSRRFVWFRLRRV
jgi:hypothetical protein